MPISKRQMDKFYNLIDPFGFPLADNFRATQPLGNRVVTEYSGDDFSYQYQRKQLFCTLKNRYDWDPL
jgi:hypothetical protein